MGFYSYFIVLLIGVSIQLGVSQDENAGCGRFKYYSNPAGSKIIEVHEERICYTYENAIAEWIIRTRKDCVRALTPVRFQLVAEKCIELNDLDEEEREDDLAEDEDIDDELDLEEYIPEDDSTNFDVVNKTSSGENIGLPLIYPGTLWCGAGDIARSDVDLGIYTGTDRCCRDHDKCYDNMAKNECKYGLCNEASFTRSHCDCDRKFYKCLENDKSVISGLASYKIAHIYFNILQPYCFAKKNPKRGCHRRRLTGRCYRFLYDYSKPSEWQFFSATPYLSKPTKEVVKLTWSPLKSQEEIQRDINRFIGF